MNRLQRKCFIGSAGVHLILILILFIGPGFLSRRTKGNDMPVLDVIPSKLVDEMLSGGGSPHAAPPPPAPIQQPVQPPQQSVPRQAVVEPPKPVSQPKQRAESVEPSVEPRHHGPVVSTTPVVRRRAIKTASKQSSSETDPRQALDERRRQAARLLASTARSLKDELSSATSIEEPGQSGGPAYANYAQAVKSVYDQAWNAPENVDLDDATTRVRVTIGSDGTVISARIIGNSGDRQVDYSVQRALDSVKYVAPFPEGAREKERTFIINFNRKTKQSIG